MAFAFSSHSGLFQVIGSRIVYMVNGAGCPELPNGSIRHGAHAHSCCSIKHLYPPIIFACASTSSFCSAEVVFLKRSGPAMPFPKQNASTLTLSLTGMEPITRTS